MLVIWGNCYAEINISKTQNKSLSNTLVVYSFKRKLYFLKFRKIKKHRKCITFIMNIENATIKRVFSVSKF